MSVLSPVLEMIGGLAFFLFGMKVMSQSLEKMAGGKLEKMLKRMTANPFVSIMLGAVITIAVQSSSATTVMLVGLVNSGLMQFAQTINVIFGANIGTTLTSWILSLSGIESDNVLLQMLKPENFSPILALFGIALIMFSKRDRKKSIGNVLVGFAVLMFGMKLMSGSVKPLIGNPEFESILTKINSPLIGVIIGTVFTGIIQSSAASIGILQALSTTGSITFYMAIPIVMGQNIGTCATSLISCIGTNAKAKRVAFVHVIIKIIGTVVLLVPYCLVDHFLGFAFSNLPVNYVYIALIHTVFNILTTVIVMPFSKYLIKLTENVIKDKKVQGAEKVLHLDERLLLSPSVAVNECNAASIKMAKTAQENLKLSMSLFEKFDEKISAEVIDHEEEIDVYEDILSTYLVKLSSKSLNASSSRVASKILHAVGDFERLGDHAVNLEKVAREIYEKDAAFSKEARGEIAVLVSAINEILDMTIEAYTTNDVSIATRVEPLEQVIDEIGTKIKNGHISRLQTGNCTIEMGFILSDLLTNFERISDHCSNIAVAVIEAEHDSYDAHRYLNAVKYGNSEFNKAYDSYSAKYSL